MKALFQYLKASVPSSRRLSPKVFEMDRRSPQLKKFTVTPVIKKTKTFLRLQESPIPQPFRITLLALLFAVPQVPLGGISPRGKVLAQAQLSCPAGTTPATLEWSPTTNRAAIESQNLSVNGINATLNFTESSPGQIIDSEETLITPDIYGGLPGPNLRFNIGIGDNPLDPTIDGPAPVGSSATLTINFSQPVTLASPLTFLDVDRSGERDIRNVGGNNVDFTYQDRITVTASNGNTPVGVNLAAVSPTNVRVTGNVAEGINENALTTENFGNVTATPSGAVTQIQVVYQPGTEFGPPQQDETIGLAQLQICVATGTSTIGDTVYNDTNGNGRQDPGEPGISGQIINLRGAGPDGQFDTPDDIIRTATTNNNGTYSIPNLPAGNYRVSVTNPPDGFSPSQIPQAIITLGAGQNLDTVDFGFTQQPLGTIGDTIFNDRNSNNVQDPGETGLANLNVSLTGAGPDGNFGTDDDFSRSATTDNNGRYSIPNLPAGNYRVSVTNAPPDFTPTLTQPNPISLAAGQNLNTADFGFNAPVLGAGETNLRLVKRITNAFRNGQPISGENFNTFDDGPGDNDNQVNQSQPVRGVRDLQTPLQSGDEVEYTLYFLAQGVNNVRFCDLIPAGTSYSPNSLSVTGVANQAQVLSPLAPLEGFTTACSNDNSNGAVVVGPTNLPGTNSGLIRFRVRVN
jgi:serine-aspartate repeat-containing protein C/D/E